MKTTADATQALTLESRETGEGEWTLVLSGRLDMSTTSRIWSEAIRLVRDRAPHRLIVDASGVTYCDGAGVGLLVELQLLQRTEGREAEIRGLLEKYSRLLAMYDPREFMPAPPSEPRPVNVPEEIGKMTVALWRDFFQLIVFVGELTVALAAAARHPRRVRWRDAFWVAETAGVNALPIVALVSFLMGLIMAFQAAVPMRQFGVEVFVADLISITMFKELGALVTAIVLAGRSGSAFAAEIGTMKVNDEIDALRTMGFDPVRFLVVTRVVAATFITPLLSIFAVLFGLIGGAIVVLTLGYPITTYLDHAQGAIAFSGVLSGLIKAFFFGILVAAIGCLRGLQTTTGAAAVGASTTSAVVSGIILIAIADGIFAVIFYNLGI